MPTLKELLENAEERTGVGVGTAARMCHASRATYRAWKRGQQPTLDKIPHLVRFTKTDPATILAVCGMSEDDVAVLLNGDMRPYINSTLAAA